MEQKLKSKILVALKTDRVISVINSQEFYFQKAKDVLSDFLKISISEESKSTLIANKKDYNKLKHLFETSEELLEFGRLIFSLISYCDSNANRKNELNAYQDKRVLALAFVRMNNWVEQLISYKFENQLSDGSVKNAIEYLLSPVDNFTMLSENHRSQISDNLFKKPYNKETFKDDFLTFFSELPINTVNNENYTYVLSCIAYHIGSEWKESIIGLVSPDGTGWQDEAVEETKDGKYIALWNHKKPNGTTKTLKLLRQCIEENEFFRIFYTSNHNALYVAEIVDFVVNQNELNKSKWPENYGDIVWHNNSFSEYANDSLSARWVYLARKIYKIEPIHSSSFVYHNNWGYPSVGCQAPIVSFLNNTQIENQKIMSATINILKYKKQIILQGPPGTGKTREAKLIAQKILDIENESELAKSNEFKLIQFHPSYTYEDFVRGIVAKPNPEGEGIIYEAENKALGQFAKLALDNYLASQGVQKTNSDFDARINALLDEINTTIDSGATYKFAEKSTAEIISVGSDYLIYSFPNRQDIRYKLLFSDIEKIFNKRNDIKIPIDLRDKEQELQLEMKGKYPYYFMILEKLNAISNLPNSNKEIEELKNYVLIIDEINRANLSTVLGELIYALEYRGEKVESIYDIKGEGNQLILPSNLFIIGTMNTSDRSVGHIDYAIRRRFAFIEVLPTVLELDNFQVETFKSISTLFIKNLDAYLLDNNVVLEKSEHLSEEFNPKDFWLGHSYFISNDDEFEIRKRYEIKPILEEYVKDGILKKSAESIINGL